MSLFSWFNSADQVDTVLLVVAIIGAVIEVGVAVAAVINVHKELEEFRKEKLEKYIEVFACVAAFFFLAEAILGCRSSVLLGIELEKLKTENLALEAKIHWRTITPAQQETISKYLLDLHLTDKPVVNLSAAPFDWEGNFFMQRIRLLLIENGYKVRLNDDLSLPDPEIIAGVPYGIRFLINDETSNKINGAELEKAFIRAGISEVDGISDPFLGKNVVVIQIYPQWQR
jgi:hypothetical protein